MSKWKWAWIVAFLMGLIVVGNMSQAANLLQDTDTRVMIERIEARNAPLSWFTGDWPLNNHFYRPIVALTFEIDHKLYGWNPKGFAATNAALCALCVIALFWMVRELFDDVGIAGGSAALYTIATISTGNFWVLGQIAVVVSLGAAIVAWLPGRGRWIGFGGLLAAVAMSPEISGFVQVRGGMIDWIPGRTASTMAFFCFAACAAYARYERLSAARLPSPEPIPLDPPATSSTAIVELKPALGWAILSVICVWLALASYEQAVMLPACLLGVAVTLRLRRIQVRWLWQLPFWGMIGVYWLQRKMLLPQGTSPYQRQQFRTGDDLYFTLADYLFPAARSLKQLWISLGVDILALINEGAAILITVAWGSLIVLGARWVFRGLKGRNPSRVLPLLTGYLLSFLAFLPMAWLKPFSGYNHYHYWALGYRSLFAYGLIILLSDLISRAVSRRALQAPPRPSPAPGSLLHQ